MMLVWRRAWAARGLLSAALVAALVAVALVTGLADYSRRAVDAGARAVLAASPAQERSLLVSGSGGPDRAAFATRDRAVRDRFAAGLGGAAVTVRGARYGTGRELTGDLGAARAGDDPVFAELTTLEDLSGHAELVAGRQPTGGAVPTQVLLPERVAAVLGLTVGERVPLRDRATERTGEVEVVGLFRPRDPAGSYWRLVPGAVAAGSETSYGPFLLDPADFDRTFPGTTSAAWLVEPDLAAVGPGRLDAVRRAVATEVADLPGATGLGSSAQTVTTMDRLIDRLTRADLVGRSSLLTPLLLVLVLGGYALILVAALLNEDRRGQTALLRARGAARAQIAGLALREAALVVLPAALLGPPIAAEALRRIGREQGWSELTAPGGATLTWAVASATAAGCLVAMALPALRRAGTYVADLAARSRPSRGAAAQRIGVDLALVGLALLAWTQLRRYSSPLAGADGRLGVDPLLVAAPTLGVLAGAVVALRLLPPAARLAERFVDRRPWLAATLGMWQAGRRPHAGPVLLLALAVGGSTLAWSLVTTGERSHVDQADFTVGADLRLVERSGAAPAERAGRLAALPGVDRAVPAWRDDIRVGREDLPVSVLSLDAAAASDVVQFDERLAGEPPRTLFDRQVRGRAAPLGVELPAAARRLAGTVATPVTDAARPHPVRVSALLTTADGGAWKLPLASAGSDGRPVPVAVDLPDNGGRAYRLAGFDVDAGPAIGSGYRLEVTGLRTVDAGGATSPVPLAGDWVPRLDDPESAEPARFADGVLRAGRKVARVAGGRFATQPTSRFAVVPAGAGAPVPALITPQVARALSVGRGDTMDVGLSGVTLTVEVVGEVDAVPASGGAAGGMLLDLPAARDWLLRATGTVRPVSEWWVRTGAGGSAEAARAAAGLPGVTVLDRRQTAAEAGRDPYWLGTRTGLLAAAAGSVLLALVGLGVDVWATARRRIGELAVLHTLGAPARLLARALLTEQTFLAGIGVGVGLLVGAGVGATMAPLVVLTRSADRPVPEAAFALPWLPVAGTALGLLLAALAFSTVIASGVRQRVAAAQLRIGGER
ncbi:FtsX-like permease family protein [Micromonospora carbonacea]|uniref:FtsX-like permease family protein n=1 Tax=Micromonospora carbonacea TaxID=47853 RepID=A0A1C4WNK9_9ACTN|nr:FtsX-like permease family protein [Micromonospora carbonacea]SCE97815.1 FtsX-like permease family protein [Micromonospora carbonacea]